MKTWYLSKTLWFNLIAAVALLLQSRFGFIIDPEAQGGILAIINLILRSVTGQPLEWKPAAADEDSEPPHFIPPRSEGFIHVPLLPLILLFTLLALGSLSGCATTSSTTPQAATAKDTPLQTAGKSLLAVKSAIVTAATATDALCKAGTLAPDKCAQAKAAYELSKPAYDSAVDAYLLMSQGYGDPAAFGVALSKVQAIATNLLTLSGGAK